MDRGNLRRTFARTLLKELQVVWPVISGLLIVMVGLGVVIGLREGWTIFDSIYFSFVTGLTIGYGDLVPKMPLTRALAAAIGAMGIMLTALLAAVAVRSLPDVSNEPDD